MAGVSISAGLTKLMPKWIMILGLFLAACGELSVFHLICPQLLFLIPLVRFPGFIWIIAVGFALPKSPQRATPARRRVEDTQPEPQLHSRHRMKRSRLDMCRMTRICAEHATDLVSGHDFSHAADASLSSELSS